MKSGHRILLATLLGMTLTACGDKTPAEYIAQAEKLEAGGDRKAAIIELKNALSEDPKNAEARFLIGRAYLATFNHEAAESELNKALQAGYRKEEVLQLLGQVWLATGKPQQIIDRVVPSSDMSAEAQVKLLALRAQAQMGLKSEPEAQRSLAEADRLLPGHPAILLVRARIAVSEGRLDEARQLTGQALAKDAKFLDAWLIKADLARLGKDRTTALEAYRQALQLAPGHLPALLASAELQIQANNTGEAEKLLAEVRRISPKNIMLQAMEADLAYRAGHFREALPKAQEVLKVRPDHLPSLYIAGVSHFRAGNLEEAISKLTRVVTSAPKHLGARKVLAMAHLQAGDTEQARKLMTELPADTVDDPGLLGLKAGIAMREGNYQAAERYLEKAYAAEPKNIELLTDLGTARLAAGHADSGIQALQQAAGMSAKISRAENQLVAYFIQSKRYPEALQTVALIEKKQPGSAMAANTRGIILAAQGDKAKARAAFEEALKREPTLLTAASNLARYDIEARNFKAAQSRFERILDKEPKNMGALLALADLAQLQKDENAYLEALQKAAAADEKSIVPRLRMATHWLVRGNHAKALSSAREALNLDPRNSTTLSLLGEIYRASGDLDGALSTYTRWTEVQPKSAKAHLSVALTKVAKGDLPGALQATEKALSIKADLPDALAIKASVLARQGRTDEALKIARAIQAQHPTASIGYATEGDILTHTRRFAESATMYMRASAITRDGRWVVQAAYAHHSNGKPAEAERVLDNWLSTHPDDRAVRHALAERKYLGKQYPAAVAHYERLVRSNPADLIALNNLASAYSELKDKRAIATVQQAFKLAPENPAVLDSYGWILVQNGQAKEGIAHLRKAARLVPDIPEIQWHLASALSGSGERTEARKILQALLASGKKFRQEDEAKALLRSLGG